MATPDWQEAWDCFLRALQTREFPRFYSTISKEKDKRFFWQIVRAIRRAGISVRVGKYMDPSLNNNGQFNVTTGVTERRKYQNPKPRDIKISVSTSGKNTETLCHEFAHAIDFLLHEYANRHIAETTAIVAGYLFTCHRLGRHSSERSVDYARLLDIGPEDVLAQKNRILAVFRKMNSLFRKGQNSALDK